MNAKRILSLAVLVALLASGFAVAAFRANGTSVNAQQVNTSLTLRGTTTFQKSALAKEPALGGPSTEIQTEPGVVGAEIAHFGSSAARIKSAGVPTPAGSPVAASNPGFSGFNGLTHLDQRLAGTGAYNNTQFNLEPPDQALCVSEGFVVESINTAVIVYSHAGAALTAPTAINQFFNLAPEVERTPPVRYGDFTSDPKCYFDPETSRWFLTVLQIDVNPVTRAEGPGTHIEIAVSATSDPTGTWNLFAIDTRDDGTFGTPSHPNCPCFPDQPLIGADANGFYVSVNEFPLYVNGFNGAQVYAMSKFALAAGTLPTVVQIDALTWLFPYGGPSYSLQPATVPPGGAYAPDTEYFLSALEFTGGVDNRIAVWALTGTGTLGEVSPSLQLHLAVIRSEVYGQPPDAQQKNGPRPLAETWLAQVYGAKTPPVEPLEFLAANDDRMNQVVFADGKLWSGVNTVVKTRNGPARVGVAYFIVAPSWSSTGALMGTVVNQGYVAVNQENTLFPSIGVNPQGKGVITFTLVGPDYYPSAAYALIDATNGAGPVHIAAAGFAPEDGFSGYAVFGGARTARWGDYSAAVAGPDGSIWFAVEYIPNLPRSVLADWGTFIGNVVV